MEPSDASRTDDKIGFTKRRSSILKAPRTSIKATPPEQEECQVEIRKPVEKKRSSRRVSFAPSNDVLLFSKEVKNGSPVRSPLQDLTTMAKHLDQRENIGAIEDRIQPITGMETLLKAPLYLSQQRNKDNFKLNDDAQNDYGERTVIFTGDETATMDMTHSHTILIANDSESPATLSDESYMAMPSCGNMDVTSTMEKSRSLSYAPAPSDQCFDQDLESFLACLPKSGSSFQNRQRKSISFMPPSNKASRRSDECGMDMTRSLTVSIDHLFQPTVGKMTEGSRFVPTTTQMVSCVNSTTTESSPDDMEITRSQTVVFDSKSLGITPSHRVCQGKTVSIVDSKTIVSEEENCMDMTQGAPVGNCHSTHGNETTAIVSRISKTNAVMKDSSHVDEVGQRSNQPLSLYSDDMDMTVSQMGAIDSDRTEIGSHAAFRTRTCLSSYSSRRELTGKDTIAHSDQSTRVDMKFQFGAADLCSRAPTSDTEDMEMTSSQTVAIESKDFGLSRLEDMEMTSSQTVAIESKDFELSRLEEMEIMRDKSFRIETILATVNPSCPASMSEAHEMEIIKAVPKKIEQTRRELTGKDTIAHSDQSTCVDMKFQFGAADLCSRAPTSDTEDMEMTSSQTVAIESKDFVLSRLEEMEIMRDKSFRFETILATVNPSCPASMSEAHEMEIIKAVPKKIEQTYRPTNMEATSMVISSHLSKLGETTTDFEQKDMSNINDHKPRDEDMDLTRSQTVAIESKDFGLSRLEEMEIMRDKSFRIETILATVNPSCPASMSEAHEMEIIKAVPKKIEQTYRPTNMEATSMVISSHLSKLGETTTDFEQKDMSNINDHKPRDEDMDLTRKQILAIESRNFGPSSLEEIGVDIKQNDVVDRNEPELRNEAIAGQASEQDMESSMKAKKRRMTLADLQLKLKHMSHMINESTEVMPGDSHTAPLSHLLKTSEKPFVENESQPTITDRCGSKTLGLISDKVDCLNSPDEKTLMTTSLNLNYLKSKCLASRLSLGAFLPKLPQRTRPIEQNLTNCMSDVEKPVKSYGFCITDDLCSVDNIVDEEPPNISSEEELSETLNTKEFPSECVLEDAVFEKTVLRDTQCQQRPFPEDDNSIDEKRGKPFTEQEMEPPSQIVQWTSNGTTATVTVDGSNSSNPTDIRCEATFDSSYRHSQFESQLRNTEDYTSDVRKKLEDGSITVMDFLKLFSIDFVIHKPRQSILPATVLSDLDRKTEDLLIEKHIIHPKQRVYEMDCQKLTEMVEELKARMREQDNPLKSVNKALWEAMKGFSEEELQHFGTKLKERRNVFRNRSKVQSHQMKTVLYTNLVQTSREAQQNLREHIEKADEMLKNLDECLHDLETELAVEDTIVEDCEQTLKSRQQGLENANKSLAECERQTCELEIQRKHSIERLDRLRAETRELENYKAMLNWVNEWKIGDQDDDRTVYTFLHESLQLEVLFEKQHGRDEIHKTERNVMNITFHLQLNDEESPCQARLVHKLLSQYFSSETTLVKRYPTSQYVPKLLHDVGLVVSRCRLLGEEIHLLRKWGSLRFNILDISCVDTQIRILFSSLKAFVKFEITIAVTHTYPFCLLQLLNFQNRFGNTTIHQLEEVVFSVTPSRNYLTEIVKSIHNTLLR